MPTDLFEKVKSMQYFCPLCEIFDCNYGCPLGADMEKGCGGGLYGEWLFAANNNIRQQAAQKILDIIKAWEPEEETNASD